MPFQERFELLLASGQANETSVTAAKLAIEMAGKHYGIQLTEALGGSLVNHLAITIKRLLDGHTLSEAPEFVWQELQDYPAEYALAEAIGAALHRDLNILLESDELAFIAVHLYKIKIEAEQQTI